MIQKAGEIKQQWFKKKPGRQLPVSEIGAWIIILIMVVAIFIQLPIGIHGYRRGDGGFLTVMPTRQEGVMGCADGPSGELGRFRNVRVDLPRRPMAQSGIDLHGGSGIHHRHGDRQHRSPQRVGCP